MMNRSQSGFDWLLIPNTAVTIGQDMTCVLTAVALELSIMNG